VRVAVVAVGDELLLGDLVNRNLAWLAERLAAAGLELVRGIEVGDSIEEMVPALRSAVDVAGAVIVTGGLGPTSDDRTRRALADLAGVELRRDDQLVRAIASWFAERGRPAPDQVYDQADLPDGSVALGNGLGTAPGIRLELGDRVVYAVPGVPAEMRLMVDSEVLPDLSRRASRPAAIVTRQVRVSGVGESAVAERLMPIEAGLPAAVRMAYLASPGEVRVRFTGTDPGTLDGLAAWARQILGDDASAADEPLPAGVLRLLAARGQTVAVAESLTGGAVAAALVDIPGASVAFVGGVVAYDTRLKAELLGVDRELLRMRGPVDGDVAVAMARGVRDRLGAAWGVATTGVAGPDPVDGVAPGTAFVAVAGPSGERVLPVVQIGDRDLVRTVVRVRALDLLRRELLRSGAEHVS
jgi:nicotinamide-nucleotide amidase